MCQELVLLRPEITRMGPKNGTCRRSSPAPLRVAHLWSGGAPADPLAAQRHVVHAEVARRRSGVGPVHHGTRPPRLPTARPPRPGTVRPPAVQPSGPRLRRTARLPG